MPHLLIPVPLLYDSSYLKLMHVYVHPYPYVKNQEAKRKSLAFKSIIQHYIPRCAFKNPQESQ